ncbi:MAG: alpha-L-rhamnosidase N-terminal domain-containing protein [Tannerellaceae bacterium]|nr:alpha-L-rhamnosidase N-terminal domain-containing protein [Tannerellaceae bacterium]
MIQCFAAEGQIALPGYQQANVNADLFKGRWKARWISVAGEPAETYGVYHFRKSFDLATVPAKFIVHASADNRYKLYVNGTLASLGPARGDIYNWNFETVDIAPLLRSGRNTLAAVVWNYAEKRPVAQITFHQTGFILQGNSEAETVINTDATWRAVRNNAYSPWEEWQVLGYYVSGPGEYIRSEEYPWGWEATNFDDSQWKAAGTGIEGGMKGARDFPGRQLVPSPIPQMEQTVERFSRVAEAEGISVPKDMLKGSRLTIPARSTARILLDQGKLTTGYLSLLYSGGKNADIKIGYAEALYEFNSQSAMQSYQRNAKNNRNDVKGKTFIGYGDRIQADGGDKRSFTPLWWRTWRYVELKVETAEQALHIDDVYGTFSAYPFHQEISFKAPAQPDLNQMLEIGWRTARLCANETYMDCPYYEQLQYFGDTRIQAMVTLYNTRDTCFVRNAIEQGRQSIVPDGITMSRYPSGLHQFIPSFSLWWICMAHDYWRYRGDEGYLRSLLPSFRGVLSFYERYMKPDRSLGYIPYWYFADWSAGFTNGEPIREKDGNSAFQDLLYILALDAVSEMEEAFGMAANSQYYRNLAGRIRVSIRTKYWDEAKGLFADTHDHRSYSQHVNSLVVLAGILPTEEASALMSRTLNDTSLIQSTIYFRYYVHQALKRAGLGDLYLDNLAIWRDQMKLGLTTWAEKPEPSRSDCHAWGASPNVEHFRILLGIDSDAPGFRKIRIAPSLGNLKEVSGTMPHPSGSISASYLIDKNGALQATLTLPKGTSGVFVWKGKEYPLNEGSNLFKIASGKS